MKDIRSIGEGEASEEKSKRMSRNFAIFFLGMLVISSVGYAFLSNPDAGSGTSTTSIDGVRPMGDRWVFGQTGREISLAYSPNDVANVSVLLTGNLNDYVQEPLFIDSENAGVLTEAGSALQPYASRMQEACYGNCSRDLPEKDCSTNIIVFREDIDNTVLQTEKCVFISGDLRAVDAYIYKLFGISNS